jgi:hypothetical protein
MNACLKMMKKLLMPLEHFNNSAANSFVCKIKGTNLNFFKSMIE